MHFELPQQLRELGVLVRADPRGPSDLTTRLWLIDEALKELFFEIPAQSDLIEHIVAVRRLYTCDERIPGESLPSQECLDRWIKVLDDAADRIEREEPRSLWAYEIEIEPEPARFRLGTFPIATAAEDIKQALGSALGIEDQSRWSTVTAAAKCLGLRVYEVTRMADSGKLRTNGAKGRNRRIDPSSIVKWQHDEA